jgi:hypothetical protein
VSLRSPKLTVIDNEPAMTSGEPQRWCSLPVKSRLAPMHRVD